MVLLIDNYDSFTYNLFQYIGEYDDVEIVRNDKITIDKVRKMNPDKIVISPGPGTPDDAGNCIEIIKNFYKEKPILGICLGHQCIVRAFDGEVGYAKELFHGKTSNITHNSSGILEDVPNPTKVARYHSLAAKEETLPKELIISARTEDDEIMAIEHKEYSLFGFQFHPESIFTIEGKTMIKNFMEI
ncbi:anthranilate synthase component II [Clostridium sp. DL1XJH146]